MLHTDEINALLARANRPNGYAEDANLIAQIGWWVAYGIDRERAMVAFTKLTKGRA